MEAWLSNGRQVLHFRPSRWDRCSQRLELSREEVRKLRAEERKQGWQPTTAHWHLPSYQHRLHPQGSGGDRSGHRL
jgi:hypothetical protein